MTLTIHISVVVAPGRESRVKAWFGLIALFFALLKLALLLYLRLVGTLLAVVLFLAHDRTSLQNLSISEPL